jgi:DASS family divalent anion:Na+ symporter
VAGFLVYLAVAALGFLLPAPEGLTATGWRVLFVFIATIVAFITRPMAMGPMVLVSLVLVGVTHTLELKRLLLGFGDETVWLVIAAFVLAGAVERTGFGQRIALILVEKLGRSMLGLGYAVAGAELVLAPVVPSNTARGGGILAPTVRALATALGSTPDREPDRAGSYLATVGAHACCISGGMFMTGMAANALVSRAAADVFAIEFGWTRWALGALVPGVAALALLPLLVHRLVPPTLDDARAARESARATLRAMGPWSRDQKIVGAVLLALLLLWATASFHGYPAALVAWIGIVVFLLTRIQSWDDVVGNTGAWDIMLWLGGLLALATALREEGVIEMFAERVGASVGHLSGLVVALFLCVVYFFSMYAFSMLTAHISAFAGAFFVIALAAGSPALVMVPLFAYFSNLCGSTTNYSTGPVIIYFGLGYVTPQRWLRTALAISLFHVVLWIALGLVWWKALGWW